MEKLKFQNLFTNTRRWSGFRYQLFLYMDFRLNRQRFNIRWIVSFLYNLLYFLIPLSALSPMIMNYTLLDGFDIWQSTAIYNSDDYIRLATFVREIGVYFYVEYFMLYFFLVDFFLRWLIADYQSTKKNWKAFIKYPFKITNLYEIAVFATLITIYYCEGHFFGNLYIINVGTFNTVPLENALPVQDISQTWLRAQIVYVALFLGLIFTVFSRVGHQNRLENPTVTFRAFVIKKLKVPLIATIFLVVLILIFSFVILKAEQSYYASMHETPPSSSPETFGQAVWYCFITITTVGYGQYIPQSPAGRVLAIILIFVGTSYYAFYGIFLVSLYTSFLQRKQIERDQELQDKIEEKKQNDLVSKIRDGVVRDLIQYKVIDKVEYESYQAELAKKKMAIQQDRVDDANKTVIAICIYDTRRYFFRKQSLVRINSAVINSFGTIYYEKTFSGNIDTAVIFPMKKKWIRNIYFGKQNIILSKYIDPTVEQILIYIPEPDNFCFGVLDVTFAEISDVEKIQSGVNGYRSAFKKRSQIVRFFGERPGVYKITKKIIYSMPESVQGIAGFFSEWKFYKIQFKHQDNRIETKRKWFNW